MDFADVLLITAAVLGGMLPVVGAALWLHYRRRIRELERELRGPDQALEARMAAVERSLDAVVEQLDQLASGQEFLGRLMSEQPRPLPRPEPPRAVTPH